MKHYLLTWYGITDLNAALGFEEQGGPILGALRTGEYTDVLILAYTDPGKAFDTPRARQQELLAKVENSSSDTGSLPRARIHEVTDAFANTPQGHRLYKDWLRSQLDAQGLAVRVKLCTKELERLNDAKGIYDAANNALDIVCADPDEKRVTCYLSPGTPVMAFTWALVALLNPELNLQVIACPDFRKPPEQIRLPYEQMAPSKQGRRRRARADRDAFDVIFHLFGEQRLPGVFGMTQFPCPHHVFVTSEKYPAEIMREFLPPGANSKELRVDPFDPMSAKVAVLRAVAQVPEGSRIGFNLTGGTKLMFAGTIAACRKVGGVPFYFETRDHKLVFLDDFSAVDMQGVGDVETYVRINGFSVSRPGRWQDSAIRQDRLKLTRKLWHERHKIAGLYRQLATFQKFEGDKFIPFQLQDRQVAATLQPSGQACLQIGGSVFAFKNCPDFARYLCGGWLEEHTYLLLEPLLKRGTIRDLRIGLEICWPEADPKNESPTAQEFDVVFTEGRRLCILECKAGAVGAEDFYKLQNCVRNYGGVEARGMLVAAFPLRAPVLRRFEAAPNLWHSCGGDVPSKLIEWVESICGASLPDRAIDT